MKAFGMKHWGSSYDPSVSANEKKKPKKEYVDPSRPPSHAQKMIFELIHGDFLFQRVGSSTIPSVKHPDDYDILVYDHTGTFVKDKLNDSGKWLRGGSLDSLEDGDLFSSYKSAFGSGLVTNFIVTKDKEFYDEFVKANQFCVDYDVERKEHRVLLFEFLSPSKNKKLMAKPYLSVENFSKFVATRDEKWLDIPAHLFSIGGFSW